MENEHRQNVVPLDDLDDFEVADDNPDVRGWDVVTSDGRTVGEVDELLVDRSAMKVRYLDVELDKDALGTDDDRHVLIPIGRARLDTDDDRVLVQQISSEQLRTLPPYEGRLDRQYEDSLNAHFGVAGGVGGQAYYDRDQFDDDRFYGDRRGTGGGVRSRNRDSGSDVEDTSRMTLSEEELSVRKQAREAGEVHVGKHTETEHVRQEVPVTREEAIIERRPIAEGDRASAQARIEDDEVRIPLHEEEIVTEKRTVPKEELIVRKRQVEDTQEVEADLRKERADIDTHGDVRQIDEQHDRDG
jgi:uncharacterized protein (TIGR02271 family)